MSDKKTVLVVDDEPDVLEFLSTLLGDHGYEVISASDGKKAFDLARKNLPDLISLDISMPEESGVRAYRNLLDDPQTGKIPIIIVTGITKEFKQFIHTRKQVKEPAAYFEKPIDKDEYLAAVKKLIG